VPDAPTPPALLDDEPFRDHAVALSALCCDIRNDLDPGAQMILVCPATALPPGEATRVAAEDPIAVFNVDGDFYAIDDTCTHQDASLADGWLDGCAVECPLHASCFDLRTGKVSGPPAKTPVRTHRVVVQDGMVYVQPGTTADGAA
jgi:3-phenylpropionate/trans-cinnamate dioxygenase ferredoxin component